MTDFRFIPLITTDSNSFLFVAEQYSIVYPASGSNNEQMLAQRLARKIAEYTGHTLSCYSDSTAKRDNEILVGKTNRYSPATTGRWIYRPSESTGTVVLTANDTTALSEVVEYFLENLQEKRVSGGGAWTISGSISVPYDQELTVMSYNTGGTDHDYPTNNKYKAAEWDLIESVLPDIFVLQEPWAS